MPIKKRLGELSAPEWVDAIEDECLWEIVMEAYVARLSATRRGADDDPSCDAVLRSGDTTMQMIRDGRIRGREECRKAASAVRKYNTAAECARPTASRTRHRRSPLRA